MKNNKSFGEHWAELTQEQREYFKGYIDRQNEAKNNQIAELKNCQDWRDLYKRDVIKANKQIAELKAQLEARHIIANADELKQIAELKELLEDAEPSIELGIFYNNRREWYARRKQALKE